MECFANLSVKNVRQDKFSKWLGRKADLQVYYDSAEEWDFHADVEGGWGGFFWEALALMMVEEFKGIAFEGCSQVMFDDHLVSTVFRCDGSEVVLTRTLELPCGCDEEDGGLSDELEDMRSLWEEENDIPYCVSFSVDEVKACSQTYKKAGKKLNDAKAVEAVCARHKVSKEKFMQYAAVIDFESR